MAEWSSDILEEDREDQALIISVPSTTTGLSPATSGFFISPKKGSQRLSVESLGLAFCPKTSGFLIKYSNVARLLEYLQKLVREGGTIWWLSLKKGKHRTMVRLLAVNQSRKEKRSWNV